MHNSDINNLLSDYSQKTLPILGLYFKEKIKASLDTGKFTADFLERFARIAERGKKIRGALVVLGYQIAEGKDLVSIYETSIFIELFHAGLLVHDDIMDNDDLRRGLPTIHKQFEKLGKDNGKSLAILVGDAAFYLALDLLINSNFSQDKLITACTIYTKYALNVIYGQALDLINNVNLNQDNEDILKVFRFKTAEYTGVLPLLVGAALGGMKDKYRLGKLEEYGLSLGWAFQIQDDILGLYGSQEKTGKPIGTDLREGKRTLLVHYIAKNGNRQQQEYLKNIMGNKKLSQTDIQKARIFFKETGAYKHVKDLGWNYVKTGKKAVSKITADRKMQDLLGNLIEFIMKRTE